KNRLLSKLNERALEESELQSALRAESARVRALCDEHGGPEYCLAVLIHIDLEADSIAELANGQIGVVYRGLAELTDDISVEGLMEVVLDVYDNFMGLYHEIRIKNAVLVKRLAALEVRIVADAASDS